METEMPDSVSTMGSFKAVIRVGAGYFDKDNNFFLVQSSGANNLKEFTLSRILAAVEGLKDNFKITDL